MEPIKVLHSQFEKLCDVVFSTYAVTIKLNVKLASYSDKYGRISYHREVSYYNEQAKCIVYNLNRDFEYFLSIEDRKDAYIIIGVNQYLALLAMLDDCFKWFVSSEFRGLFGRTKENELVVAKSVSPNRIEHLPMGKWLEATPKAISYPNGDYATGMRFFLSSYESYVDITFNELQGMIYTLKSLNMFMAAQNMLNYLQRPDYGSNLYDMSSLRQYQSIDDRIDSDQQIKAVNGRKPTNKNRSFFDKMSDLEG